MSSQSGGREGDAQLTTASTAVKSINAFERRTLINGGFHQPELTAQLFFRTSKRNHPRPDSGGAGTGTTRRNPMRTVDATGIGRRPGRIGFLFFISQIVHGLVQRLLWTLGGGGGG